MLLLGRRRDVYRIVVGKCEGKISLGRPRCRWEDLQEWDVGIWTGSNWLWIGTGGGHL